MFRLGNQQISARIRYPAGSASLQFALDVRSNTSAELPVSSSGCEYKLSLEAIALKLLSRSLEDPAEIEWK